MGRGQTAVPEEVARPKAAVEPGELRERRLSWAELMRRVFIPGVSLVANRVRDSDGHFAAAQTATWPASDEARESWSKTTAREATGSTYGNSLFFQGRELDPITGLYDFRQIAPLSFGGLNSRGRYDEYLFCGARLRGAELTDEMLRSFRHRLQAMSGVVATYTTTMRVWSLNEFESLVRERFSYLHVRDRASRYVENEGAMASRRA